MRTPVALPAHVVKEKGDLHCHNLKLRCQSFVLLTEVQQCPSLRVDEEEVGFAPHYPKQESQEEQESGFQKNQNRDQPEYNCA